MDDIKNAFRYWLTRLRGAGRNVVPVFLIGFAASVGLPAQAMTQSASPSSCVNSDVGENNWSNPERAVSSNNSDATVSLNDGDRSDYLQCTNLGFSLPANAVINGVTVNIERGTSSTAQGRVARDAAVRLVKGGTVGSTDRATSTPYTTSDTVEAHGDAADLWGTTWTAAEINATDFGVAFAAQKPTNAGGSLTVSVDHISVTVDYTVPFACAPPANTPSGLALSCVCDTFDRTNLNPSPIFGSDWIISTSDSTGLLPTITNAGYLRLTNNTGNNAKAATVPGIFPAAGNYISVEFQQYAYNGTGADGIAVTLSDYAVPAVPGAYGGSLGYAQETGIHAGFAGGWLGVALDEYGNFQNPTEGRLGGPGFIVQSVGARGSGSGQTGYRWLGGTSSLSPEIDNNTSSTRSRGHYYQVVVDARNDPVSTAVTVNRDTGGGYGPLISIPNVYTAASGQGFTQAPVPTNWQISFTGSTGGSTNIHEIGGLRICASTIFPPSGGVASGFNAIDEVYGTPPGVAVQDYLTGHIYTKLVGTPFKLDVAALSNNQIVTTYAAAGAKPVTVNLVDNSDGVSDPSKDCTLSCTAACKSKPSVTGGSQTLTFTSGATDKGQKQSAHFTINSAYRKLVAIISDGTTSACSTDSFSVRPLSVVSVVSIDTPVGVGNAATNAGTGGTPKFRAGADSFALTATTSGVSNNPSGYNGVLKINNAAVTAVSPATVPGAIAGTFPAASPIDPSLPSSPTAATGVTFTYSEVGAFSLQGYDPLKLSDATKARGVYDDTWTAVDSVDTRIDCVLGSYSNTKATAPAADVGKYGCSFGLLPNTVVFGRFVPHEFRVVPPRDPVTSLELPMLTSRPTCAAASTFSYLDEGMGVTFALEALAGGGNITRNYAGALAKLPLYANASSMNFAGAVVGPPFVPIGSARIVGSGFAPVAWPAMGDANAGVVALTGTVTVSSLATAANNRVTPDGPFTDASLGIAPVDPDGVGIVSHDLDSDNSGGANGADHKTLGKTTLYFGELRLLPAISSERLDLTMPVEVLRWNGSAGFVPNGDDCSTLIPAAALRLGPWTKNLSVGETTLPATALAFTNGRGALRLPKPGAGNDGSVTVKACLVIDTESGMPCPSAAGLSYLTGRWRAATKYDWNPAAVASFGLYKGAGQIIHFQENY